MTCPHENTEPVEVGGHWGAHLEVVAQICVDCLERLPAEWGCADCQWAEVRRLREPFPRVTLVQPCSKHRRNA